jgi:hypothetical protein
VFLLVVDGLYYDVVDAGDCLSAAAMSDDRGIAGAPLMEGDKE